MFAYCGNNPVNRRDDLGSFYTPGQLHDFVVQDICNNNPNKSSDKTYISYLKSIIRGNKRYKFGFCDVYDTVTHEVWEVKRISLAPSCSPVSAAVQLANYVSHGVLREHPDWKLKFGGEETTIKPNVFSVPDADGSGMYLIGYTDVGNGLVYYDYYYIPSPNEAIAAACAIVGIYAIVSGAGFAALGAIPGLLTA